jgi:Peptidase A4 family
MFLQKQKRLLQTIDAKLGKKLVTWHALILEAPSVFIIVVFGLTLYLQPMPPPSPILIQKAAITKSTAHNIAAPKVTQLVAAPPPIAPPSNPVPVPVKVRSQTGTPKVEPIVTPAPNSSVSGLTPTTPAPAPSSPTPSPPTTTGYLSTNWSGYLATSASFTKISGSWTATLATGNGSTITADSTWIGIGGVTSGDLIQVGTQNIIAANGQVSTSAFYELLPNVSQPVPGVTVSPGDVMTASITEVSGVQWTISITDTTDGQSDTFSVSYASSLSSAEWIEEDPSFSFGRQIPFDNFHEAFFTGGSATANGVSVTIAASTAQPVTMVNNSGQAIAVPSAIGSGGASFTVSP